ncbi:hypothetical protein LINPERPRIM_LOCUS15605 [Linum perenne]
MREKGREREGERVRGWGVLGSSGSDRHSCNVLVRDSLISIVSSNRFASVDFRVVVTEDKLSHFVFLDVEELLWLKSVLEVAAGQNWSLPKDCHFAGKRRMLIVRIFRRKGVPFLNLAEKVCSGRQYFVNIPAGLGGVGWNQVLRMLSDVVIKVVPPAPPLRGPQKSFAEVLKGATLHLRGRCEIDGKGVIRVQQEGVAERLRFLERCLCFRVVSKEPEALNWTVFRSWMQRNWGVDSKAQIWGLGSDLWMIECGSREEVNRVVALGRTLFGTSQVFLDRWTSEAGRARLLRKEGAMWIVAKGIPLHIRSVDLFRQIGEVCGGFVEHDSQWCPLSSVRIKVAGSGSVPENVVVRHLDEVFDIRIWKESSGMLEKDVRGKEPKRKEVVERAVNGLSCLGAEFFSGSGRGEEGGPSSVFTAEAISSLSPGKIQGGNHFFGADEVEATVERRSGGMGQAVVVSDFVQRSLPGGRTSEGLKDTLMRCVDATKRGSSGYDMQEKFLGGLKRLDGFVGLMLREDVGLCVLTRQCSDDFLKPFLCLGSDHEGGLFREEAGQKGLGPVGSGSILIPFNLSVESWRGIRCGPARLTKVGLDWVKKGGKADEGPDWWRDGDGEGRDFD